MGNFYSSQIWGLEPWKNILESSGNYSPKSGHVGLFWWSSGKVSAFQCKGCGFDPWSGNYMSRAAGQLRPCSTAREARVPQQHICPCQGTVIQIFWDKGLYIKWCILRMVYTSWSKPLTRSGRNVIFEGVVDVGECPKMGQIGLCIMQTYSAQKGREKKPKGRDNFLCLTVFLSCYKIWILLHTK